MNSSDIPGRITKAFGVDGDKNTIPVDSSSTTLNGGQATMSSGFPPVTMIPISAGGIPPAGKDFNGILYSVSLKQQWQDTGMGYPFNSAFSTAINGYPKGALVPNSTLTGFWINLIDGNTSNPEVSSSALTGWVPAGDYGVTTISGLAATSITLSTLQAAKDRILLSGSLTANINLILPAWMKKWTVVNGCTGSFTITVKTASGTGVILPTGLTAELIGDGTNIIQDLALLGYPGRLLNVQVFNANGTYTPTRGTKKIKVKAIGGGGAGGSAGTNGASTISSGSGGGAGTFAEAIFTTINITPVTIGVGGVPNISGQGGSGGTTSFGSLISCPGGGGGPVAQASTSTVALYAGQGAPGNLPTITGGQSITSSSGQPGPNALLFGTSGLGIAGQGAPSVFGGGAPQGSPNSIGNTANAPGAGGSGSTTLQGTASKLAGSGAPGVVIIEEYA